MARRLRGGRSSSTRSSPGTPSGARRRRGRPSSSPPRTSSAAGGDRVGAWLAKARQGAATTVWRPTTGAAGWRSWRRTARRRWPGTWTSCAPIPTIRSPARPGRGSPASRSPGTAAEGRRLAAAGRLDDLYGAWLLLGGDPGGRDGRPSAGWSSSCSPTAGPRPSCGWPRCRCGAGRCGTSRSTGRRRR